MDKLKKVLLPILLALCLVLPGCSSDTSEEEAAESEVVETTEAVETEPAETEEAEETAEEEEPAETEEAAEEMEAEETDAVETEAEETTTTTTIDLSSIPEYSGDPYVEINGNVPDFDESDLTTTSFETYSSLDSLGRCGVAYANIGTDLMPADDEERGDISSVEPTGWHSVTYDIVESGYLYNRCHLIGYQLTAENANEKNLITGTRYLNVDGMLPFENMVADYIEETGNHVLYRVTPIFEGDNLVASGVQMEAMSVEDSGEGILFNVYCYNVQPGVEIDYATGDSWLEGEEASTEEETEESSSSSSSSDSETTYILNTNSKKFHYPDCSSVSQMSESNKEEYTGTREELIEMGYEPCGNCNP